MPSQNRESVFVLTLETCVIFCNHTFQTCKRSTSISQQGSEVLHHDTIWVPLPFKRFLKQAKHAAKKRFGHSVFFIWEHPYFRGHIKVGLIFILVSWRQRVYVKNIRSSLKHHSPKTICISHKKNLNAGHTNNLVKEQAHFFLQFRMCKQVNDVMVSSHDSNPHMIFLTTFCKFFCPIINIKRL